MICLAVVAVSLGKRIQEDVAANRANPLRYIPYSSPLSIDPAFFQQGAGPVGAILSAGKTTPLVQPVPHPAVPTGPAVSAQAYLIGNVATGQIYAERNGTAPLPIASMSKLMTAIVATETITPSTKVEITPLEASVYPDLSRIGANETFTSQEMLYPLLLDSSNIAAEALASSTNRARFLDLMNSSAWEIGLPTTYFADPSGLSPLNQASAEGFFDLAKYVYESRPDLLAITRTMSMSVGTTSDHGSHDFVSIHPFISDPRFIGGKTGHTPEAGDTMLTILNIEGQPIAFIILGSNDRAKDTALLIDQLGKTLARQ
jgi:D-alanyl-D-alanine carboxypeptidase